MIFGKSKYSFTIHDIIILLVFSYMFENTLEALTRIRGARGSPLNLISGFLENFG